LGTHTKVLFKVKGLKLYSLKVEYLREKIN